MKKLFKEKIIYKKVFFMIFKKIDRQNHNGWKIREKQD